jgi:hypothetical protein
VAFRLSAEIPLPGPLQGKQPQFRDGSVEIDVLGGTLAAEPVPGAAVRWIREGHPEEPPAPPPWIEDELGRRRFRTVDSGHLEAQRRCAGCRDGWRRDWRLRVAGNGLAPPLVHSGRVWFGTLDNRVYCVKAKSGHRLWVADVGARVSSRIGLWTLPPGVRTASAPELLLVIPDGGSRLIALDGTQGTEVGALRLAEGEGRFVSGPLATAEGAVVVTCQRYAAVDAALLVYELLPLPVGQDGPAPPPAATGSSASEQQSLPGTDLDSVVGEDLDDLGLAGETRALE